jgi:hypothetical protein
MNVGKKLIGEGASQYLPFALSKIRYYASTWRGAVQSHTILVDDGTTILIELNSRESGQITIISGFAYVAIGVEDGFVVIRGSPAYKEAYKVRGKLGPFVSSDIFPVSGSPVFFPVPQGLSPLGNGKVMYSLITMDPDGSLKASVNIVTPQKKVNGEIAEEKTPFYILPSAPSVLDSSDRLQAISLGLYMTADGKTECAAMVYRLAPTGSGDEYREVPEIYLTKDSGKTWSGGAVIFSPDLMHGLPTLTAIGHSIILGIVYARQSPYISGAYVPPPYLVRSDDKGASWSIIDSLVFDWPFDNPDQPGLTSPNNAVPFYQYSIFSTQPDDENLVFLITYEPWRAPSVNGFGYYISLDKGATWSNFMNLPQGLPGSDMAGFSPIGKKVLIDLYATTSSDNPSGFDNAVRPIISLDNGLTWVVRNTITIVPTAQSTADIEIGYIAVVTKPSLNEDGVPEGGKIIVVVNDGSHSIYETTDLFITMKKTGAAANNPFGPSTTKLTPEIGVFADIGFASTVNIGPSNSPAKTPDWFIDKTELSQ